MITAVKPTQVAIGVIAGVLVAGSGYAFAQTSHPTAERALAATASSAHKARTTRVTVCVNNRTHAVTMPTGACPKGTRSVTWDAGVRGPTGARGPAGRSVTGPAGQAATVSVGSVITGVPGSQAAVTNVGTSSDAKLNFSIPAGQNGTNATDTGPDAYGEIWMGSTSAELAPGNNRNITGVGSGGVGAAVVDVEGCSSAGLTEPVISVTADHDNADTLTGANNTANTAVAWIAHWSTVPNTSILAIDVQTTNPTAGSAVDSDFGITVQC